MARPTTVVIVQARMASTRLPGKVLADIAGRSVLAHVLARCTRIEGADTVCCAMPEAPDNDPVATEAEACGATVVRGPEHDVLQRYHDAAAATGADVIMRVTSDCPLIDPGVCGRLLALRAEADADYAANNMPASFPHGLDCEAFTRDALSRAAAHAETAYQREHVTPWLRTAPELRRVNLAGPGGGVAAQRWTLDYPEDLAFLRALFTRLADTEAPADMAAVMAVLRANPELAAINRARRDTRAHAAFHA